jgi:hypothetical protein
LWTKAEYDWCLCNEWWWILYHQCSFILKKTEGKNLIRSITRYCFPAFARNVLWIPRYALLYWSGKSYATMGSDISCRWPRRSHIEDCRKLNRKQTRKSVTALVFSLHSSNAAQMWHSFNPWTYDVQGFCYRKKVWE